MGNNPSSKRDRISGHIVHMKFVKNKSVEKDVTGQYIQQETDIIDRFIKSKRDDSPGQGCIQYIEKQLKMAQYIQENGDKLYPLNDLISYLKFQHDYSIMNIDETQMEMIKIPIPKYLCSDFPLLELAKLDGFTHNNIISKTMREKYNIYVSLASSSYFDPELQFVLRRVEQK